MTAASPVSSAALAAWRLKQGLDAFLTRPQDRRPRAVGASAIRILAQVADGRIEDTDHGSTAVIAACEDRAGERQKAPHQVQPRELIAWGHRVDDGAALQLQIVDHGPAVLPVDERGCPCDRRQLGAHASRLLTKVVVQTAIAERRQTAPEVATRIDRQSFWTKQMLNATNTMRDRLKASELLGKSQADFIEVRVAPIVTDPHANEEQLMERVQTLLGLADERAAQAAQKGRAASGTWVSKGALQMPTVYDSRADEVAAEAGALPGRRYPPPANP